MDIWLCSQCQIWCMSIFLWILLLKKKPMYIYSLYTTDLGWKDQRSKKRWHSTAFPIAGKITLNEAAISTALETNTLDSMQLRHIEDVVDVLGKHQCTMRLGDEVCWSNNQFARRFMQRWKTCLWQTYVHFIRSEARRMSSRRPGTSKKPVHQRRQNNHYSGAGNTWFVLRCNHKGSCKFSKQVRDIMHLTVDTPKQG